MTIIELLIAEVRKLATESPDNVYHGNGICSYESGHCDNGSVGCVFGQAAHNIGWNLRGEKTIDDRLLSCNIVMSEQQLKWCYLVQSAQDKGRTWAEAIRYADEESVVIH